MEVAEGVDAGIVEAILEGVRAGKYHVGVRIFPRAAGIYSDAAREAHERATTLLGEAVQRLGVGSAGPSTLLE